MSKVAIVTDSSAYLPADLIAENHLHIVPLTVIWGEECYLDGVDITPADFYRRLETATVMPSTSQPSVADFEKKYRTLLEDGYEILSILISEDLSGTVHSATQAKALLPEAKIEIVNSKSTSMALGFQVLAAAQAAKQGADLAECKRVAEKARDSSGLVFVVDTLEFLHRGGRIGGAKRFVGTLLDIKPVLAIEDGVVISLDQVRTHTKALDRIIEIIKDRVDGHQRVRLATLHANNSQTAREILETAAASIQPVETVFSEISPVIGTHSGPGAVGLAYLLD